MVVFFTNRCMLRAVSCLLIALVSQQGHFWQSNKHFHSMMLAGSDMVRWNTRLTILHNVINIPLVMARLITNHTDSVPWFLILITPAFTVPCRGNSLNYHLPPTLMIVTILDYCSIRDAILFLHIFDTHMQPVMSLLGHYCVTHKNRLFLS